METAGVGQFAAQLSDLTKDTLDYSKEEESGDFTGFYYSPYYPTGAVTEAGPLIFDLGGVNSNDAIMLSSISLRIKCKVTTLDDAALVPANVVSIVSLFPHSLFENINVKINGVPVSDHGRHYQYKAYLQTDLSYSESVKKINFPTYTNFGQLANCNVVVDHDAFRKGQTAIETSQTLFL